MKTSKKMPKRLKATYVSPRVKTYKTRILMQQLGPARAYSNTRSVDDELLGIDH